MKTADDFRRERDELDAVLADLGNLVAALRVVSWQLCGEAIDRHSELGELRDAVVGIGNAMHARIADI